MGEIRNAYKVLVGKPEENGPLTRCRHRREDNIKMYFFWKWGGDLWIGFI
jgi:hypothetical protein